MSCNFGLKSCFTLVISNRSRVYDFGPNCTPLSSNAIIYNNKVSLRILSFCIFNFLIPVQFTEWRGDLGKWHGRFSIKTWLHIHCGTPFLTLIWGPVLSNPDIFETIHFFLHESSFPSTQKPVNSLIYPCLSVWFTVRFKKYLDSNEAWILNGCSRRIPDTLNPKKAFVLKHANCVILNKY